MILHFHGTIIQQNEFMLNISCNIRGYFVFVDHLYFDKCLRSRWGSLRELCFADDDIVTYSESLERWRYAL